MTLAPKSKVFLFTALVTVFAISAFYASFPVNAQANPINHALQDGEQTYVQLKAAEQAGANITSLVAQYNSALSLLDKANILAKAGNETGAAALASQADYTFIAVNTQAQSLREASTLKTGEEATLRNFSAPLVALGLAIVAVVALLIYRRVRDRQFSEMSIRVKTNV